MLYVASAFGCAFLQDVWWFIAARLAGGTGIGVSTVAAPLYIPKMVEASAPDWGFLFFCAMMVLQLIWVRTMVIETKGIPLEEIQRKPGVVPG